MYKILMFGTGSGWKRIKHLVDYNSCKIIAFVDNDPLKHGRIFNGLKIISPAEITNIEYSYILITSQFYDEITNQLLKLGVERRKIYSYYSPASIFKSECNFFKNCFKRKALFQRQLRDFKCELAHLINIKDFNTAEFMIKRYESITNHSEETLLLKKYMSLKVKDSEEIIPILSDLERLGFSLNYNSISNLNMKYKPKESFISVIIPVYKDAEGLTDTLVSLNSQSLDKQYYEIIVINDGGDLNITKVCKEFDIQMVEVKPNRGSYYARNRGIERSRGEYLAFVDADIKVPYNWLENGISALRYYDYVTGDIKIEKCKIKTGSELYDFIYSFQVVQYIKNLHYGPTGNLFVRRNVFEVEGGFDERLRSGGDWEFGDRVYRYSGFKQIYSKDISVIHPPRNYRELIKKFKRIKQGHQCLRQLFPNRFCVFNNRINIFREILKPPIGINKIARENKKWSKGMSKYWILICFWWIKTVKFYYEFIY